MSPIDYSALQRAQELQHARQRATGLEEQLVAMDRAWAEPPREEDPKVWRLQRANGFRADPSQPWGVECIRIRAERERLTQEQKSLDARMFDAMKEAVDAGATYEEIGQLVGLTKQRIGQLVKAHHEQES